MDWLSPIARTFFSEKKRGTHPKDGRAKKNPFWKFGGQCLTYEIGPSWETCEGVLTKFIQVIIWVVQKNA
jgi:hypothetical protein